MNEMHLFTCKEWQKLTHFACIQLLCLGKQKILHEVSLAGVAFASPPGKGMISWSAVIRFVVRSWLFAGLPSAEKKSSLISAPWESSTSGWLF